MKNFFRAAAVVSFLCLATACGGPVNNDASSSDDLSKSFDPITQYPLVKKAASAYTTNVVAVSLSGERQATASKTSTTTTSFLWVWTVMGSDGTFCDVQINSSGVKVLKHEHRFLFTGEQTFDPSTVLVNGQDLIALANDLNMGQPIAISLASSLAAQQTGPRYDVTFPSNGYMTIDGVTGQASKN